MLYQVEGVGTKRFWVAIAGIKGDWPYLRKCMGLAVGFSSKRKCHMCPGDEPFIPWHHFKIMLYLHFLDLIIIIYYSIFNLHVI